MTSLSYTRYENLLDQSVLSRAQVSMIGVGGAANLACNLARAGIGRLTIVDMDNVSSTNPATQGFGASEIGMSKVEALSKRITELNPACEIAAHNCRFEELTEQEAGDLWNANPVLGMTDSFKTQAAINREAVARKTDAIFAICYVGCEAIEVTASFASGIVSGRGCHRCHTKARYDAYDTGFENPEVIPSHIFAAEALNSILGLLTISTLHWQAGSELPIASIAKRFSESPCLIQRIGGPDYWAASGDPFANTSYETELFATKLFPLDTPQGWHCPDCGTEGLVDQASSA